MREARLCFLITRFLEPSLAIFFLDSFYKNQASRAGSPEGPRYPNHGYDRNGNVFEPQQTRQTFRQSNQHQSSQQNPFVQTQIQAPQNHQFPPRNDYNTQWTPVQAQNQNPQQNVNFNQKTTESSLFYEDGEVAVEQQEYLDYIAEWTTPSPKVRTQIPPTPAPLDPSLWPTSSSRLSPMIPNFPKAQLCAAYTDDICFKQQEQLQPLEVHECCQNRLLLTDICVSGKCSNTTLQLCCIQKFLQAKMTCCQDNTMSEPGMNGFEFSKCCYENFIDHKDECCPFKYADLQWRFVHELCLPHVDFDLSTVRVPTQIPGTTVTAQFDFSKSGKWKFECKNGQNIKQYSYYPEEEDEETEVSEE
ncbi:hypothetical protein L596_016954 [Steinernema carpocapsae]|uniref:Domain of unknown function DB domain-containing protein n=1 Tax=Steinernema carpocapsae TaxID=34508 RepID=A0A4U5N075_STECR|nr:hypothetical protein L596_016954 [Steinernema carpocapsae]